MLDIFSLIGISMFIYERQWRELEFKDALFNPVVLTLIFLITIYTTALSQGVWGYSDIQKLEDITWALLLLGLIPINRSWGSNDTFWWGGIGCAILSGGIAIYEVYNHGPGLRVTGSKGKAIMFGDLSMIASTFSVIAIMHFKKRGFLLPFIAFMAALLGLFGSIQSGTRGAWIFIPVFVVILLIYFLKKIIT